MGRAINQLAGQNESFIRCTSVSIRHVHHHKLNVRYSQSHNVYERRQIEATNTHINDHRNVLKVKKKILRGQLADDAVWYLRYSILVEWRP